MFRNYPSFRSFGPALVLLALTLFPAATGRACTVTGATLDVQADDCYYAYINGVFINQSCNPKYKTYDAPDHLILTPAQYGAIVTGTNVIAIEMADLPGGSSG